MVRQPPLIETWDLWKSSKWELFIQNLRMNKMVPFITSVFLSNNLKQEKTDFPKFFFFVWRLGKAQERKILSSFKSIKQYEKAIDFSLNYILIVVVFLSFQKGDLVFRFHYKMYFSRTKAIPTFIWKVLSFWWAHINKTRKSF
jgi:hypothetical protein